MKEGFGDGTGASEGLWAWGAVTLSHKGARGGAPVLRAGERGEGWRPAFSWCSVVSYRAPPPKGEHKGEASADSALPGAAPRTAQSGGRAGPSPPHTPARPGLLIRTTASDVSCA